MHRLHSRIAAAKTAPEAARAPISATPQPKTQGLQQRIDASNTMALPSPLIHGSGGKQHLELDGDERLQRGDEAVEDDCARRVAQPRQTVCGQGAAQRVDYHERHAWPDKHTLEQFSPKMMTRHSNVLLDSEDPRADATTHIL